MYLVEKTKKKQGKYSICIHHIPNHALIWTNIIYILSNKCEDIV